MLFASIHQDKYFSYENALQLSKLPQLGERRAHLSLRFALKCASNEKTKHMFPLNTTDSGTRNPEKYVCSALCIPQQIEKFCNT